MKLLAVSLFLFSIGVQAKNCEINNWETAYSHMGNDLDILFDEAGVFEPVRPGLSTIKCPELNKFQGNYVSITSSCPDIQISVENKVNLSIDKQRDFISINGGETTALLPSYTPYLSVKTSLQDNSIVESWTSSGKQVATYKLTLESKNDLTLQLTAPLSTFSCQYNRR